MKKHALAALLCSAAFGLSAQWTQLNSGTAADLATVHFANATNGWVAGESGAIRHTTDGGTTWSAQTSGTGADLYGMYFSDAQNGWVVGESGTIRHTSNGGTTWAAQTSGTVNDLYAVHFFDASHGMAVGATGVILSTVNGGASWTISAAGTGSGSGSGSSSGEGTELNDVQMTSATTAYACGAAGYFVKTTNGGTTWTTQLTGVSEDFAALHFPVAGTGYVAYELGKVKLTNGNSTFTSVYAATSKDLKGVWFVNAQRGWVVGEEGRILFTPDGGISWSSQNLATVEENLQCVHFPTTETGFCVGEGGVILKLANAQQAGVSETAVSTATVFPNPSTNSATVSTANSFGPGTLSVWDAQGRLVHSGAFSGEQTLDTANWESGFYTVTIAGELHFATAKITKR